MEKARRRNVPAFGEWNYYSSTSSPDKPPLQYSAAVAGESSCWYVPEPEACSDAWSRYSPPQRRRLPEPKKARTRPETAGRGVVVAGAAEHKRAVAVAASRAPAKGTCRRVVVRPVDEGLYRVPPPDHDTAVSRLPRCRDPPLNEPAVLTWPTTSDRSATIWLVEQATQGRADRVSPSRCYLRQARASDGEQASSEGSKGSTDDDFLGS